MLIYRNCIKLCVVFLMSTHRSRVELQAEPEEAAEHPAGREPRGPVPAPAVHGGLRYRCRQ